MNLEAVWSVAGAILVSLGGGALIVAALFRWLGEVTAKRILQKEQAAILRQLEELKKDLNLLRSNYEKNADWIIEFYSVFYRHYQAAYRAARSNTIRHSDRPDEDTHASYMEKVDDLASEWNQMQSLARILLPTEILKLHEEAVDKFNAFKDAVKAADRSNFASQRLVTAKFDEVHRLKEQMETAVRDYLKTDKLVE